MSAAQRKYSVAEAGERLGAGKTFVLHCLRAHWVAPAAPEEPSLGEEELARLRLIRDLQQLFGANDEAIPVILHLLDQLYELRKDLSELRYRKTG